MIEQAPLASFAVAADAELDLADLAARLGDRYTLVEAEREQVDEEYLDTFDWGLYHSGRTLARSGRRYRLYSAAGFVVCEERGPRKKRPFWWDFAEGQMRDEIREGAQLRALCPQLQLRRDRQSLQLLNEDAKIVLKLWQDLTTVQPEDRAPVELLSLHLSGIRGYGRQFQSVCSVLRQEGRREMAEDEHFLAPVFAAADIFPESAGLKFAVTLEPQISVRQGLSEVGLTLLRDIRRNLPGVLGDIDTEFLHDLRIALRRTRSLLSIFARVIPQTHAEQLRDEFRWITQITGSVRDCDVYLLQMDDFRAMLPARLHPGLNGYIQGLREFRKREFKSMKRQLKSSRFDRLLKDWQAFLEEPPAEAAAADQGLCRDFAAKAMKRRFKKVIRKGSECGPESPDTLLHALRIQTKKLRYLLEFFRSLFPLDEIDLLIRHLKKLQNNLGEFNDLSVQQTMLGTFRSPRRSEDLEQMLAVAAALGGLITHLADRQQQVRGQFEETFVEFAGSENRALLQAIIGSGGQQDNSGTDGEKR